MIDGRYVFSTSPNKLSTGGAALFPLFFYIVILAPGVYGAKDNIKW